jgi:S1-C subfamily serine protease
MFESPDDRTAYHAARTLIEVDGQPHDFLTLKSRLQAAPGVVVTSVPKSIAVACQEKLAALGLATQISHQLARPVETAEAAHTTGPPGARSVLHLVRDRPGTTAAVILGIKLIAVVFGMRRGGSRADHDLQTGPLSSEALEDLARRAVVGLTCENRSGSGFLVSDGIIVTTADIVCPAVPSIDVRFFDGSTALGRVIRVDNWLDLALVRTTDSKGRPLQFVDATSLERGEAVVVVDGPGGAGGFLSRATVSDSNHGLLGTSYLQIDVPAATASAGGPLLDDGGRAAGVVISSEGSSGNLWLVVPGNYLVDGPDALLPELEINLDRERWEARLREAGASDRNSVAEARSTSSRTAVVAASADSPTSIVATVARWSASTPSDQRFSFTIRRGDTVLCSPTGTASTWERATGGRVNITASRWALWLERNDLLRDTYVTSVSLDTTDCTEPSAVPGATLVLHSGAPSGDRTMIQSK